MPHRLFSPLRFSVLIALLLGAFLAAQARATDTIVTYRVTNHSQQVTVKNGTGKTLLSKQAATPTLQAIIAFHKPVAKDAPPDVRLTLEDANGHALWAVPVSAPPGPKPLHSMQFTAKSDSNATGTLFTFTFSTEASANSSSDTDSDADTPKTMSVVCAIGADGRLTSMNAKDDTGKTYQANIDPKHMTITGPDGQSAQADLSGSSANGQMNGTIEINGTKITITTVKRDGKQYLSFPWNGHQVFVEQGCTFTINGDGDLTVNAPAKTAGK